MRRLIALSAFLAALVLPAASVVPNPDFELAANGDLAVWSLDGKAIPDSADGIATQGGVRVVWDTVSAGNGKRSLRLHSTGEPGQEYAMVASGRIKLLPDTEYELSFHYKAQGLQNEDARRETYAAAIVDLFINRDGEGRIDGCRLMSYTDTPTWASVDINNKQSRTFRTPAVENCWARVRLSLANKVPNHPATLWYDDISLVPVDPTLANVGVEEGGQTPASWQAVGSGKQEWVTEPVHGGKRALSVSDAGSGRFSGWQQTVAVRADRTYAFGGYAKGGTLNPDGFIGGGAFCIIFTDADGQQIGEPVISQAVIGGQDWTFVRTQPAQPPAGAVLARLIAGLEFCRGTAWFDDLSLTVAEAPERHIATIRRTPEPDATVTYLPNLLANGDIEAGADGQPANWKYVGKSSRDWTDAEIEKFHTEGRPSFSIGRGRGEWSDSIVYAGKHSLLDIAIDPPLSPRHQWYGRMPVEGFWLSDPMDCAPGKAYMAGGWLRPGVEFTGMWFGPLEIRFYDARGRQLPPKEFIRTSLNAVQPGAWVYWATMPAIAPDAAVSMRLRFGHELIANAGGQGRTFADNLAVWQVPDGVALPSFMGLNTDRYFDWFETAFSRIRPPYTPAPAEAPAYDSVRGRVLNLTDGNLFGDPQAPIPVRFQLFNQLGEKRQVKLVVTRTDWLGNAGDPITSDAAELSGFGTGGIFLELPPSGAYGAFYLDVQVLEGDAPVGRFAGRYGVLPPLLRPRTGARLWGVTPLVPINVDGSAYERELAQLLKTAGFHVSWIRMQVPLEPEKRLPIYAETRRLVQWYRALDIEPVIQLMVDWPKRQPRKITYDQYRETGRDIARHIGDIARVVSDFNIETANSKSPFRGGGKDRLTDTEYDTIMAAVHDGLKEVSPQLTVLIGNIATDMNADTIRRLYGAPGNGKFDGAVSNAYMGQQLVVESFIREFDKHGDTTKTVWNEEQAEQRSPWDGDLRRYGEADGPRNMVRTWLALAGKGGDRLRAVTMWGFVLNSPADIMMVTGDLQPRPQFTAHAVMADTLADARVTADLCQGNISLYEWTRTDGPVLVAWANSGEQDMTLEVENPSFTSMDLMGNRTNVQTSHGLAIVHLTTTPVYLFGGGKMGISKRLELELGQATQRAGQPSLRLRLTNNGKQPMKGEVTFAGPVADDQRTRPFEVAAGKSSTLVVPVKTDLPTGERTIFGATCKTSDGAVFAASAGLDFAVAVKAATPPALDGTWKGWDAAPWVSFGNRPQEVSKGVVVGESYDGTSDILGRFRLMWDDTNVYLGVEALDDSFVSQPERGRNGFMADSIEFAFQPEHLTTATAVRYEYEMYLPSGDNVYAASRRTPAPGGIVDTWKATVKPTGHRGDVVYQVAVPWSDLGGFKPGAGKTMAFGVVINDQDNPQAKLGGGRGLIHWFSGIHTDKNPEQYGDVTLVAP